MSRQFNTAGEATFYWIKVPRYLVAELRERGFYDGRKEDRLTEVDRNLLEAFHPVTSLIDRVSLVSSWRSKVLRETFSENFSFPTIWNPHLCEDDGIWLRDYFGSTLIEIEADTSGDFIHKFLMSRWIFGIFYHVACMGNWIEVVSHQLDLLRSVGLDGIYVSILGTLDDRDVFLSLARERSLQVEIRFHHSDLTLYEVPAMRMIENWCLDHPDAYFLYFHTKGVSDVDCPIKSKWRTLMELYVIANWRENCSILERGYDAVGVCWKDMHPLSHFSGNFYIAKADFITRLTPFATYYMNPRHSKVWQHYHRLGPEFWLGSGDGYPNVYSLVARNKNIEHQDFWDTYGYLILPAHTEIAPGNEASGLLEIYHGQEIQTISRALLLAHEENKYVNFSR